MNQWIDDTKYWVCAFKPSYHTHTPEVFQFTTENIYQQLFVKLL